MKQIGRRLLRYFFQGLIFLLPVVLTGYIIYFSFTTIDGIFKYKVPGLGILIAVVGITIIGALGSTFIAQPIVRRIEKIVASAPLIKIIYSAIRDLLTAFVGKEKKFNKPVLVRFSRTQEVERLGFVTETDLTSLHIQSGKSAVYVPHSYNFSGNLYIVPNDLIEPLNANATDIMKFIVTGGVVKIGDADTELIEK